ncbi:glutaredoxin family protein [Myceligenerans crystallogenes]|uniref:glutaredoxin family protein n=1 Tax=Myceligenerans crystallogenes TaxID=316335 RepID=UPI0031E3AB1F
MNPSERTSAIVADVAHRRPERLTMYGAPSSRDCRRSKAVLDIRRVDFEYIDIEREPARAGEAEDIAGRDIIPVLIFPDGSHLAEPTNAELAEHLDCRGL